MSLNTPESAVSAPCPWVDSNRQLFKIPEVETILGVNASTVRRLVARGELEANLKLRHVLVPRASIQRFINAGSAL